MFHIGNPCLDNRTVNGTFKVPFLHFSCTHTFLQSAGTELLGGGGGQGMLLRKWDFCLLCVFSQQFQMSHFLMANCNAINDTSWSRTGTIGPRRAWGGGG